MALLIPDTIQDETWLSGSESVIANDVKKAAQETADRLVEVLPQLDYTNIEAVLDWIMKFISSTVHSVVNFKYEIVYNVFWPSWQYYSGWSEKEIFANQIIEMAIADLEKHKYINFSLTDQISEWISAFWAKSQTKARATEILDF